MQSSKVKNIVKEVPNLFLLETIDSTKLATKLNNALQSLPQPRNLRVFVQVDTSGETTKSGVSSEELDALLQHIRSSCPNLTVKGLMTIGAPGDLSCFQRLVECRNIAAVSLDVSVHELELSMGMSSDFEEAIHAGATSVRVGSTIFGERDYSRK